MLTCRWLARAVVGQSSWVRIAPSFFFILFLGPLGPLTYGPQTDVAFTTGIRDTYVACRVRTDISTSGTVLIMYFHVPGLYWSNTQILGLSWTWPASMRTIDAIISNVACTVLRSRDEGLLRWRRRDSRRIWRRNNCQQDSSGIGMRIERGQRVGMDG